GQVAADGDLGAFARREAEVGIEGRDAVQLVERYPPLGRQGLERGPREIAVGRLQTPEVVDDQVADLPAGAAPATRAAAATPTI
ncbi:MAG TPA: hypothetical protein VF406_11200, partial [Thermodesulfobacteriota bacterium]